MAENNPIKKQYFVKRQNYPKGEYWSEEKYNAIKDRFFDDYKDAEVYEIAPMGADEELKDNDALAVRRKNFPRGEFVTAGQWKVGGKKFLNDFPDAEVSRISPIDIYGDKLREIYDRIGTLKNELEGLPQESDAADLRNMSDEDIMAEAQRQITEKPGLDRRHEINRELEQLYRMREENPAWQRYWEQTRKGIAEEDERLEKMQKQMREDEKDFAENYDATLHASAMGGHGFSAGALSNLVTRHKVKSKEGISSEEYAELQRKYNVNRESLAAARMFLDDAKKVAAAPSRYGGDEKGAGSDFWQGIVDNKTGVVSLTGLVRAGLNTHLIDAIKAIQEKEGKDVNILDLVKKDSFANLDYLEMGQKELVKAFVKKAEVEGGRSETLSRSYQAGQSAIESVGFMLDFLMMGGIGDAAAEAVAGNLVKSAGRGTIAEIGADALYGTVKALAMTPVMPSSYSNFVNNLLQFTDDPNDPDKVGRIDLSGKRMLQAAGDVLIENISETIGSLPMEFVKLPLSKVSFPAWVTTLSNSPYMAALKQAGYNGFFEEMVEEWTGNALRVISTVDKDALKNFATWDQQFITAGAFAPMSLLGLPVSAVQLGVASKAMKKSGVSLENIVGSLKIDDEAAKNALISEIKNTRYETPEELATHMGALYKQIVDNGGSPEQAAAAILLHTQNASRYNVVSGMMEQQKDEQRSTRLLALEKQIGDNNWHHEGKHGVNYVRTITDEDGNLVKQGDVGELCVKGPGVMKCYYNDPKATAETLRGDWLRTGDMAMEDEDGFIFLVDRKKDVIISGGENLYPVQIEDFLITNRKIKDVAVIGLPDSRLGEIAAAIIELHQGETCTEEEINEFCLDLPRYKRPRKIIFADVPRNPTGKIEKPRLRKMYGGEGLVAAQNRG